MRCNDDAALNCRNKGGEEVNEDNDKERMGWQGNRALINVQSNFTYYD